MAIFDLPFLDKLRKAIENIITLTVQASGTTTLSNGDSATLRLRQRQHQKQ